MPLYALGRRAVELIPYVPIADGLRFGVSIFSYCGQLTFGITGDYDAGPDVDVLAREIEHELAALVAAAESTADASLPERRRAHDGRYGHEDGNSDDQPREPAAQPV
jgi:diacylglycerol O-acyltransferase